MLSFVLAVLFLARVGSEAHARGVELYKEQKYAEAIATLQEAAKTEDPAGSDYKESALLIGQSYFMLTQAPKAIPWLEKVTNVNEANYMLGYAYLQNKQQDASEAAFARLFGLKPETAAGHLLAAQMMLKQEYEPQARSELDKALATDPNLPGARLLLAEIAIHRGQLEEAIGELKQELTINPSFSTAWYRLGDAYSRQENWTEAIPNLQRAVWLNPDFSGPFILLGKCYFKTANYSNAEGIFRRALTIDPRNYSATYLLGQTLINEGKKDEGREVLDKLKTLRQQ
ncbi:MAG: tetratricopeptide repeat protein [Acidobacteriaceae bacterium]|nr:tetratricopeptide repeat protein [Acidobacteriaceae bacterium]MBV9499575.1 tetratricopeptide repeat protein [Acidobacteriaceae bacterium]